MRTLTIAFVTLTLAGVLGAGLSAAQVPPASTRPAAWAWQRAAANPILKPTQIPARAGALYPVVGDPSLMFDEGRFKMWFGYGGLDDVKDERSVRVRTAYAESTDGLSWSTIVAPSLDVGAGWDLTNAETPSVLKDPALPAGHPRKYRMYYSGLDRAIEQASFEQLIRAGMGYGIGLGFSPDGRRFMRLPAGESPHGVAGLVLKPNPPVIDGDAWDFIHVADPHVLLRNGTYHMWYTSFAREHRTNRTYLTVGYATSPDGIRWTKHGHVIKPDQAWESARSEPHVGRPYVLWTGARFEMFYDAVDAGSTVRAGELSAGVGYAWSTDGKNWSKESTPIFVTNRGRGERAGMMIGTAVLLIDGRYRMVYGGYDPDEHHTVFNLATAPAR